MKFSDDGSRINGSKSILTSSRSTLKITGHASATLEVHGESSRRYHKTRFMGLSNGGDQHDKSKDACDLVRILLPQRRSMVRSELQKSPLGKLRLRGMVQRRRQPTCGKWVAGSRSLGRVRPKLAFRIW